MEQTVSVSKGVFVYKNGLCKSKSHQKHKQNECQYFTRELWYRSFKENWNTVETKIKNLRISSFNLVLSHMVDYIKDCYSNEDSFNIEHVIPTVTLLTGVNQPDHMLQFNTLVNKIRNEVTPHVVIVQSQDTPTLKHLIENIVRQLITDFDSTVSDETVSPKSKQKINMKNCNISLLDKWYQSHYNKVNYKLSPCKKKKQIDKKSIVIILQDFEGFNCDVLQDFVLILSCYNSRVPIVLVFGVATSVSALHKSFPYHVSSKLLIKVFQSHSSSEYLNQVLDGVLLTPECPFHLSGTVFQLLKDVFLFYDFSVSGFIQGFKFCMMEHYYNDNTKCLCADKKYINNYLSKLTKNELEEIRRLPSFRPHVEQQDYRRRIQLIENDNYMKEDLEIMLLQYHDYLTCFHTLLSILYVFVKDLPKKVLGHQKRELYQRCISEDIVRTNDYKECMQLLLFQSKETLHKCLIESIKIIDTSTQKEKRTLQISPDKNNQDGNILGNCLKLAKVQLSTFIRQIDNASIDSTHLINSDLGCSMTENIPILNRQTLKKSLYKATKYDKLQSEYEMVRHRLLEYLTNLFGEYLQPLTTRTYHELFLFDDISYVKRHIVGAPRGAIHNALNNPAAYLMCKCCEIKSPMEVRPTFPDLCIIYKLHSEAGKHINLYDWLQAFVSVLQPENDTENRVVSHDIQARFTRAVSELQFLGFIKASKRKTDHVIRLTW